MRSAPWCARFNPKKMACMSERLSIDRASPNRPGADPPRVREPHPHKSFESVSVLTIWGFLRGVVRDEDGPAGWPIAVSMDRAGSSLPGAPRSKWRGAVVPKPLGEDRGVRGCVRRRAAAGRRKARPEPQAAGELAKQVAPEQRPSRRQGAARRRRCGYALWGRRVPDRL